MNATIWFNGTILFLFAIWKSRDPNNESARKSKTLEQRQKIAIHGTQNAERRFRFFMFTNEPFPLPARLKFRIFAS